MALVTLGFLAFVLVALFWVAWAVVWLVAALFWFALPLTLLVLAAVAWRKQARYWHRAEQSRAGDDVTARAPLRQTGNRAFDEYREQALRSLDEERQKFGEFLEQRRKSKDREAFDRYMAARRSQLSDGQQGLIA